MFELLIGVIGLIVGAALTQRRAEVVISREKGRAAVAYRDGYESGHRTALATIQGTPEPERGIQRPPGDVMAGVVAVGIWRKCKATASGRMLTRLKYEQPTRADAQIISELLGRRLCESILHTGWAFDVITWVPMTDARLKWRGFNQGAGLARSVARHWTVEARGLLKRGGGQPQAKLKRMGERRANAAAAGYRAAGDVSGLTVLIVDDIMTTGATVEACARALIEAGAARVYAAVLYMSD